MNYYLIHRDEQLQVIPVTPEQEIDFLLQYSLQILASGETIREVLQVFHELPLVICNGLWLLLFSCRKAGSVRPAGCTEACTDRVLPARRAGAKHSLHRYFVCKNFFASGAVIALRAVLLSPWSTATEFTFHKYEPTILDRYHFGILPTIYSCLW